MLTTIASFREPWEAHMFRARLEAEGIPASIAHENHIWNNWPISTALGGVKVQVPQSDVAAARAIEQRCRNGDYHAMLADEFGDEPDSFKCPKCGSREVRSWHTWSEALTSLVSVFFGTAILPAQPSGYRCKVCEGRWEPNGE